MTKAAFNKKKKKTFHQHSGIKFKEEISEVLHLEHLNGAMNWTLYEVDQIYLESFEMWC
jgi:hypothetical protein